jgi:uncharacterized protein YhfF
VYAASLPDPDDTASRFSAVFRIGRRDADADARAVLILHGVKTVSGALWWKYQTAQKPLPRVGSFSLMTDAREAPVCVIETTAIEVKPFGEVDTAVAEAHGERDRTLEGCRARPRAWYADDCRALGREADAGDAGGM